MKKEGFQKIYPFTTENIAGYITQMDINNKKVFTLGSSCDQAFNSLLLGASEVTIFDINERTKEFYELKRKLILETPREKIVDKVVNDKNFQFFDDIFSKNQLEQMNVYLQNEENYNRLRNILEESKIHFINGDLFHIDPAVMGDRKYDRMILSNVLEDLPTRKLSSEKIVYKLYTDLMHYLNDDAIIQFYYLYGSMYPTHFIKIIKEFEQNQILLERISCDENDSVIFVKKKNLK